MLEKNLDVPVAKKFIFDNKYFLYDTFTNRLFNITKDHFFEISILEKIGISEYVRLPRDNKAYRDIIMLLHKGILRAPFIKEIIHPNTHYLPYLTSRCVNDVVLQVTRECNFRCRYCLYAGNGHVERTHEKINMPWSVAKQGIDFLFNHSVDSEKINLSFYGGEPLLNFELIKKSVEYIESIYWCKKLNYKMTINGSLVTDYILDFLVDKDFEIVISLDGNSTIQNKHRKFFETGNDTFRTVFENVEKIRCRYNEYFYRNISFLPVILDDESYEEVLSFFRMHNILEQQIIPLKANLNGIDYINTGIEYSKSFDIESDLDGKAEKTLENCYLNKNRIPASWHHNGQCIPGIRRLFIDINGYFYPCEKVIENNSLIIGDVNRGFDLQKIGTFLNVGKLTEKECKECWAIRFCEMCISSCLNIEKNELSKTQKNIECKKQKEKALSYFKRYIKNKLGGKIK